MRYFPRHFWRIRNQENNKVLNSLQHKGYRGYCILLDINISKKME